MSNETSWDSSRWREGGHQAQHDRPQRLPLSAPTAINPASQSSILETYSNDGQNWRPKFHLAKEGRASEQHSLMADPYSDASTYRNRVTERHSPAPGGNHGPQLLKNPSPHQPPTQAWRSLHHDDRRPSATQYSDAPLTLHIPRTEDLPRISPPNVAVKNEPQPYTTSIPTPAQSAPSLPSFASFQQHTSRLDDPDVDGPEIAPMASRLSCYTCTKLNPMVREIAIAVAELDENVQSYCNKAVTRTLDIPSDSPVRAAQWIVDRLRSAKGDMQDASRRAHQPAYFFPHPPAPPAGLPSRPTSPGVGLKRQAAWDREGLPNSKRPRSGDSPDDPSRLPYASSYHGDRRASIDYLPRSAYSPQPTESVPLSAYPRQGSPSAAGRTLRPLPSPSSMAYPHSAAASLPPPTVHPGSPAPSYPASASIHTASTNSVTSAHIADLQHQVTLKSLALQTLQSEYSGMLQKFQRERVKSQTIEKKTTVSEQEVNDLTGRNEELTEQVKSLEMQVEDSERKRENDRIEAAKEKEQWGRMLDMGGRLQAKLAVERQNLVDERDELKRRIAGLDSGKGGDSSSGNSAAAFTGGFGTESESTSTSKGALPNILPNSSPDLKREVAALQSRIDTLTAALRTAHQHNQTFNQSFKALLQGSGDLDEVLHKTLNGDLQKASEGEEAVASKPTEEPRRSAQPTGSERGHAAHSTIAPSPAQSAPPVVVSAVRSPPKLAPPSGAQSRGRTALPTPTSATGPSIAEMASAGRAVSPGPEELGIHVQPSTSSPEELIQALGPVPAPLPPFRFGPDLNLQPGSANMLSATKQSSRSPPEAYNKRGGMGSHEDRLYAHQHYRQVPSPYTNQFSQYRTGDMSSPSTHSSPGSSRDGSPPNAYGPRQYSDQAPQPATPVDTRPRPGQDVREQSGNFRRYHPDMTAAVPTTGFAGFRQWSHQDPTHTDAPSNMPPPPRPFSAAQAVGFDRSAGA